MSADHIQESLFIRRVGQVPTPNCEIFNYNKGVVYGNLPIVCKEPVDETNAAFSNKNVCVKKYYYPLRQTKNSMNLFERILR